jgi:DNA repair protein RecO (recombination protein O)
VQIYGTFLNLQGLLEKKMQLFSTLLSLRALIVQFFFQDLHTWCFKTLQALNIDTFHTIARGILTIFSNDMPIISVYLHHKIYFMLTKTKGIVLHTIRYSDTSSVVTIYTEAYGRTSFMVRGLNNKRSTTKAAFFQPLTLVDMDITFNPGKDIQSIKDIRIDTPLSTISSNPIKNALALFLSETLYRTLRISTPDEHLYTFIAQSIQILDYAEELTANFHLVFLLKLTRFLGCEPHFNNMAGGYFDLINGEFVEVKPLHTHYIEGNLAQSFFLLSNIDYFSMSKLNINRNTRIDLVKTLLEYYRLHITNFHGVNSLAILQTLFD